MQAKDVVADSHLVRTQRNVFQRGGVGLREREVFFHDTCLSNRPDDFIGGQPVEPDKPALVHNRGELPDRFDELRHRLLVLDFLRDDEPATQRIEIALRAAALFGRLGQEQVTGMV